MTNAMEHGSRFLRDLGDAANRNPLSAALIGSGVLWLLASRGGAGMARAVLHRTSDMATDALENASSRLRSAADSAGSRLSSASETVRSRGADALDQSSDFGGRQAETLSEGARSISGQSAETLQDLGSSLTEIFRRQPLALGAIGIAIGAGIAASLPLSQAEADILGQTSDAIKRKAEALVGEQTARARNLAGQIAETAAEEARKQGLTPEAAKSKVGEITAKLGRVADAAKDGVKQGVSEHGEAATGVHSEAR